MRKAFNGGNEKRELPGRLAAALDDAGTSSASSSFAREFLSESYFRYFKGRHYTDSVCYLTITLENKKSRLMSFDSKMWRDFLVKIRKVQDQLRDGGIAAKFLDKREASEYVDRFFAMNFKDGTVSMSNFKVDDETIGMGDRQCKVSALSTWTAPTCPR